MIFFLSFSEVEYDMLSSSAAWPSEKYEVWYPCVSSVRVLLHVHLCAWDPRFVRSERCLWIILSVCLRGDHMSLFVLQQCDGHISLRKHNWRVCVKSLLCSKMVGALSAQSVARWLWIQFVTIEVCSNPRAVRYLFTTVNFIPTLCGVETSPGAHDKDSSSKQKS